MSDIGGDEAERTRRAELVLSLRSRGVRHLRTLAAIETIPRSLFAPSRLYDVAYADRALPIACGQTLESPSHLAKAIDSLNVGELDGVLEIGTGSGYATAIFATMSRRVVTIERWRSLSVAAKERIDRLGGAPNVTFVIADGAAGRAEQAPFERIFLSAAVETPPPVLINQLKPGGVMVLPIGTPAGQRLTRLTKARDGAVEETTIDEVRLQPLASGVAASL
ncbi:protein-L-isoaspartate(D-aspartate) O-methyltransferase [Methylopila sp. M107]|uniref:protein-L-isoaspartate(D-aspartate) O-methyltransferase n=1 Tax=Methylopila sp. M107 TaxID=1101190 RepID=UPI00037080B7|nr:protein-L-isoaspartate(D-aspartate) O-methyltransferase [Methylopila sp. M107]